jgi:hypothetical protein
MEEITIFSLCGFLTRIFCVDDPMVVKTVSKRTESLEKEILASGSLMRLSFLQPVIMCRSNTKDPNKNMREAAFTIYKYTTDKPEY